MSASESSIAIARTAARAATDKIAEDIVAIDDRAMRWINRLSGGLLIAFAVKILLELAAGA